MKRTYHDKETKEWREKVYARDGKMCAICGKTSPLNVHHLIPWNIEKTRFDAENGIVLCPSHHCKYGYGLSPHSHGSALFFIWMMKHRMWQLMWVEKNYEI